MLALLMLAVPLVAIAGGSSTAGASVASVKPVTFTGGIRCTLAGNGQITSSPGLLLSTARTVTITISGSTAKCTGQTKLHGATIKSGFLKGSVKGSFDCLSLTGTLPAPKGTITWKTTGKPAAKTSFTLSAGSYDTTTNVVTYHSFQKGSFPGHKTVIGTVKASETTLLTACESSGGLTKISLKSGAFT